MPTLGTATVMLGTATVMLGTARQCSRVPSGLPLS
jgi:hypothetical protein